MITRLLFPPADLLIDTGGDSEAGRRAAGRSGNTMVPILGTLDILASVFATSCLLSLASSFTAAAAAWRVGVSDVIPAMKHKLDNVSAVMAVIYPHLAPFSLLCCLSTRLAISSEAQERAAHPTVQSSCYWVKEKSRSRYFSLFWIPVFSSRYCFLHPSTRYTSFLIACETCWGIFQPCTQLPLPPTALSALCLPPHLKDSDTPKRS